MAEEEYDRVSMQWPIGLKARVRERVGPRGLTELVVDAVEAVMSNEGYAGLAIDVRQARTLAQQLANILVTVQDPSMRMTFLLDTEFPDWIDTSEWPSELVRRQKKPEVQESVPEPPPRAPVEEPRPVEAATEAVIPAQISEVRLERVEAPQGGTVEEPLIIEESTLDHMDAPQYASLQHVHAPDGKCLKNQFGDRCNKAPAVLEATKEAEDLPHDAGAGDLFSRLRSTGALKSASDLPKPPPKAPEPAEERKSDIKDLIGSDYDPVPGLVARGVIADPEERESDIEDSGPDSGPLEDVSPQPATEEKCPVCGAILVGSECWSCGYGM